jgi:probable addiction module antidote protein
MHRTLAAIHHQHRVELAPGRIDADLVVADERVAADPVGPEIRPYIGVTEAGFMPVGLARSVSGGYAGGIFRVVGVALIASWFVAVVFTPHLGVVLLPKTKTRAWDPAEHLVDPALIAAALGDIARAKGMRRIARDGGLWRESLYKALSVERNPEFATIMKVIAALGLQLHASTADCSCWLSASERGGYSRWTNSM